jgi:hypothetical protein
MRTGEIAAAKQLWLCTCSKWTEQGCRDVSYQTHVGMRCSLTGGVSNARCSHSVVGGCEANVLPSAWADWQERADHYRRRTRSAAKRSSLDGGKIGQQEPYSA